VRSELKRERGERKGYFFVFGEKSFCQNSHLFLASQSSVFFVFNRDKKLNKVVKRKPKKKNNNLVITKKRKKNSNNLVRSK